MSYWNAIEKQKSSSEINISVGGVDLVSLICQYRLDIHFNELRERVDVWNAQSLDRCSALYMDHNNDPMAALDSAVHEYIHKINNFPKE